MKKLTIMTLIVFLIVLVGCSRDDELQPGNNDQLDSIVEKINKVGSINFKETNRDKLSSGGNPVVLLLELESDSKPASELKINLKNDIVQEISLSFEDAEDITEQKKFLIDLMNDIDFKGWVSDQDVLKLENELDLFINSKEDKAEDNSSLIKYLFTKDSIQVSLSR